MLETQAQSQPPRPRISRKKLVPERETHLQQPEHVLKDVDSSVDDVQSLRDLEVRFEGSVERFQVGERPEEFLRIKMREDKVREELPRGERTSNELGREEIDTHRTVDHATDETDVDSKDEETADVLHDFHSRKLAEEQGSAAFSNRRHARAELTPIFPLVEISSGMCFV